MKHKIVIIGLIILMMVLTACSGPKTAEIPVNTPSGEGSIKVTDWTVAGDKGLEHCNQVKEDPDWGGFYNDCIKKVAEFEQNPAHCELVLADERDYEFCLRDSATLTEEMIAAQDFSKVEYCWKINEKYKRKSCLFSYLEYVPEICDQIEEELKESCLSKLN